MEECEVPLGQTQQALTLKQRQLDECQLHTLSRNFLRSPRLNKPPCPEMLSGGTDLDGIVAEDPGWLSLSFELGAPDSFICSAQAHPPAVARTVFHWFRNK